MEHDLIDRLAIKHDIDPKEVRKAVGAQFIAAYESMVKDRFEAVRFPGLGSLRPNDPRIKKYLSLQQKNPDNCPMPRLKDRAKHYIDKKGLWPKPEPNPKKDD